MTQDCIRGDVMQDTFFYQNEYNRLKRMEVELLKYTKIYFYGAGLRSEEILQMQGEGFSFLCRPAAFLVSEIKTKAFDNPNQRDGIPVCCIDEIKEFPENSAIVVIAMNIYHEEIKQRLLEFSGIDVYYLTDAMEQLMTREFLVGYFQKYDMPVGFLPFAGDCHVERNLYEERIHTYSVMCERDARTVKHFEDVPWISKLQAGASLAQNRIADIGDDTGESISALNAYYNELTGLYWVWKNTDYKYTGICHYRRRFESDVVLLPLIRGEADVILPLPFVIGNDLRTYYKHFGEEVYYDLMLLVIKEKYPAYYDTAVWCTSHCVFLPNNICIARRDILDEYCSFLFDVIFLVEERMKMYSGKRQHRCWLSEHVSTIYFLCHLKDYKTLFSKVERCW